MLNIPFMTITAPLIMGAIVIAVPKRFRQVHGAVSLLTSAVVLALAYICFTKRPYLWTVMDNPVLRVDNLAGFVGLFIGFFGVAITFYSIGFMKEYTSPNRYYANILWTIGASIGAAFANNLILLLIFWGFLGFTLYTLILAGGPASAAAAKKTFIIVGGSDAVMLFGIAIIWYLAGTLNMDAIRLNLSEGRGLAAIAFIALAIASFAKAGAMPFHTWIPDSSEVAPTPVMALLPASLDKLLGIYLLTRLVLDIFVITPNSAMSTVLLAIGAITIIAAVMMALVQHNLNKLLAYHAVSQVGYMVLGIGTANVIGIAGGLFHMVNHAIYKSCLFLSGGSVEKSAGTAELDKLGGLASLMPITFATCLVASLSISGVPPFNGFVSKWMIYQSLLELGKSGSKLWILWLAVAMFGSALTLASFMKLIYSAFFSARIAKGKEVSSSMWLPQVVLALLCVIFGIFAYRIPIRLFIVPSLGEGRQLSYDGIWNAPLATALILAGLLAGFLFFILTKAMPTREEGIFVGGEVLDDNAGIKGTSFYNTIKDIPLIGGMYALAEKKVFDIYEEGAKGTFFFTDILKWLHNGILPTYLVWCLVGMLVLFLVMVR